MVSAFDVDEVIKSEDDCTVSEVVGNEDFGTDEGLGEVIADCKLRVLKK